MTRALRAEGQRPLYRKKFGKKLMIQKIHSQGDYKVLISFFQEKVSRKPNISRIFHPKNICFTRLKEKTQPFSRIALGSNIDF